MNMQEWQAVKSKFLISPLGGGRVKVAKAFTERGLYMLATILKSAQARNFKVRELGQIIHQLPGLAEKMSKK
jgi:hypothetical protein